MVKRSSNLPDGPACKVLGKEPRSGYSGACDLYRDIPDLSGEQDETIFGGRAANDARSIERRYSHAGRGSGSVFKMKQIILAIRCLPGSLVRTVIYAAHIPFWRWF